MAYDEDLAARVRACLAGRPDVTARRMFGGLAFLVGGHMAVAVSGQGGLMLGVDPADTASLVAEPHVTRMEMRGRQLTGWVWVAPAALGSDAELTRWVALGVQRAAALPPKPGG